jgi:phosphomannomutase
LNSLPDGRFSAHLSETIEEENYRDLRADLEQHGGEFGMLFDGDGDRLGIF